MDIDIDKVFSEATGEPEKAKDEGKEKYVETPAATQAFEDYIDIGRTGKRSLSRLAEYYKEKAEEENRRRRVRNQGDLPPVKPHAHLSTLEMWSAKGDWIERLKKRMDEEREETIRDAAKNRQKMSKMRLTQSQILQRTGMQIMEKAELDKLTAEDARKMLGEGLRYVLEGMKNERLELGETSENWSPPKPLHEMTAEELEEYAIKLTETKKKEQ